MENKISPETKQKMQRMVMLLRRAVGEVGAAGVYAVVVHDDPLRVGVLGFCRDEASDDAALALSDCHEALLRFWEEDAEAYRKEHGADVAEWSDGQQIGWPQSSEDVH